jgi:hypothetical protein
MTKGTPDFDPRRYEFREDPRKSSLIEYLDSVDCWDHDEVVKNLPREQRYYLELPPILVEKPKYRQLAFDF